MISQLLTGTSTRFGVCGRVRCSRIRSRRILCKLDAPRGKESASSCVQAPGVRIPCRTLLTTSSRASDPSWSRCSEKSDKPPTARRSKVEHKMGAVRLLADHVAPFLLLVTQTRFPPPRRPSTTPTPESMESWYGSKLHHARIAKIPARLVGLKEFSALPRAQRQQLEVIRTPEQDKAIRLMETTGQLCVTQIQLKRVFLRNELHSLEIAGRSRSERR